MDLAIKITEAANTIRKEKGIKLRWPLKELLVSGDARAKKQLKNSARSYRRLCNVKSVTFGDNFKLPSKNLDNFMVYLDIEMSDELKRRGNASRNIEGNTISKETKGNGCIR